MYFPSFQKAFYKSIITRDSLRMRLRVEYLDTNINVVMTTTLHTLLLYEIVHGYCNKRNTSPSRETLKRVQKTRESTQTHHCASFVILGDGNADKEAEELVPGPNFYLESGVSTTKDGRERGAHVLVFCSKNPRKFSRILW